MAYRKHLLHHRIKDQPADSAAAASGRPEAARGNPQPGAPSMSVGLPSPQPDMASGGAHPSPPGPMVLPLALVRVNPVDDNYVTLSMEDLAPVTTADGAMIPASGPGRWDQLRIAGGGRSG
jgi:hypothetical protein